MAKIFRKELHNRYKKIKSELPVSLQQDSYFLINKINLDNSNKNNIRGYITCTDLFSEYDNESGEYSINFSINQIENHNSNTKRIFANDKPLEVILSLEDDIEMDISTIKLTEISSIVADYVLKNNLI
ncbi:MAG: hypothetical protein PHT94_02760 [Candidatus Nanoarchaeia archaeon]|nr:hypothetical protein [Candidatus Nanoarchaeia archaeon]